ncbi:hypothetical protein DPMN_053334 [Dreissena polymorpha]|uniref:Uncharacterized protein n=1 Tax=Dreissena polymorpha TaxID=45954 RepID=A0A9D4CNF3_DREPO|nr:hypothetical protein DPMN_053334 [Dreissena polymorpha]
MIANISPRLGLIIDRGNILFKNNASNDTPTTVQGEVPEEVDSSTYIDNILHSHEGKYADVRTRIAKA